MADDLEQFIVFNAIPLPNLNESANINAIPLPVPTEGDASYSINIIALQNDSDYYTLNAIPLPNLDQFVNFNIEVMNPGPHWFGTDDGEVVWLPGLMWNGTEFVRYQMWDTVSWQTSVGHDTT